MANEENVVLIIGATGTVGRQAVRAALARGAHVRALVRSQASARQLPRDVEAVRGDLGDAHAVKRALHGVRAALYVSPHERDEERMAAGFIRACEDAKVRLVFIGVHVDGGSRASRALKRFIFGRMLPHYAPKFRIAERARRCAADPIVLVPTNYFQNDELFREQILAGSFPQPFAKPVNRVDVRDLGEAAARALLDPSLPSGAYPVIGPSSLVGDECAAIWSEALGRPVQCERDMQRVNAAIQRALQGKKRADFIATYAVLRRFALPTEARMLAQTTALLGRAPTPYRAYVRDALAGWTNTRELKRASR